MPKSLSNNSCNYTVDPIKDKSWLKKDDYVANKLEALMDSIEGFIPTSLTGISEAVVCVTPCAVVSFRMYFQG